MNKRFTPPKVSTAGTTWFVWFRFDGRLFKKTGKANYSDLSTAERRKELQDLARAWKYRLEVDYFNPITKKSEPPDTASAIRDLQTMTFEQAIRFAIQKKKLTWSKKTGQDYDSVVKYLLESATVTAMSQMIMADVRRKHFITILHQVQVTRKLSAKGFNKYKDYLSSIVGELVQWEVLEANSVQGIKYQPTPKIRAHIPPTDKELEKIMKKLQADYVGLYRFCAVLYGTTIREKEILALQIRDINLDDQIIKIIPNRERNNSKVLNEREVVIPNSLLKIFVQLNVGAFPKHYYIFSKGLEPGATRTHSNTPTALWKQVVKNPPKLGGLGIKKDLYGLKKLAGNDMVHMQREAKNLLRMPQQQMGHTTSTMTEVYVDAHVGILNDMLKTGMKELGERSQQNES